MADNVTLQGAPLATPQEVAAVIGSPGGAQFTVVMRDGTVLDRAAGPSNDWQELDPVPLSARAIALETYTYG